MFVMDDLAAWLVGWLADTGRKQLVTWVLGTEQERALRSATQAALDRTVDDLHPRGSEQAKKLATSINGAFSKKAAGVSDGPTAEHATVLEALRAAIFSRLERLEASAATGQVRSLAELSGVPVADLATKLTGYLLEEIKSRGAQGTALTPLAAQLNADETASAIAKVGGDVQTLINLRTADTASGPINDLPYDVSDFVGRDRELQWLRERSQPAIDGSGARVLCISGMPSAGKSVLAVHVAYMVSGELSDVQLYADLKAAPDDALRGLLAALGVTSIPSDEPSRQGLYRRLLANKRAVVVLDDSQSSAQVKPLLPGGRHCLTLVTSRARLDGLDGAECLELRELDPCSAEELIRLIVGDEHLRADPAELVEIARLCGYLPLALRIAAAKLRNPRWSGRKLVSRLSDERSRLAELQVEGLDLRASFAVSYEELDERERLLFRRTYMESPVSVQLAAALIASDEEIASLKARQEDRERLIRVETERLRTQPARHDAARAELRTFWVAAELRESAASRKAPPVSEPSPGSNLVSQSEHVAAGSDAAVEALRALLPADAEIKPSADGFLLHATFAAASDQDAFRAMWSALRDAGCVGNVTALVRDPEREVTEFMDGITANHKSPVFAIPPDWLKANKDATRAAGPPPYLDCEEAEDLLGRLSDKQLAQPVSDDSYRIHDLLRAFASAAFARDDQASVADLSARCMLCELHLQSSVDSTVSDVDTRQMSPMEGAHKASRMAQTAERLGVSEWIAIAPPPGLPPPSQPPGQPSLIAELFGD